MTNSESTAGTNFLCSIIVTGSERHSFNATHSSSRFDGGLDYMFSATGSAACSMHEADPQVHHLCRARASPSAVNALRRPKRALRLLNHLFGCNSSCIVPKSPQRLSPLRSNLRPLRCITGASTAIQASPRPRGLTMRRQGGCDI